MQGAKYLLPWIHLRDDRWQLRKRVMAVWSCRLQTSLRQPPSQSLHYKLWLGRLSQSDLVLNLPIEKSSEKVRDTHASALARRSVVSLPEISTCEGIHCKWFCCDRERFLSFLSIFMPVIFHIVPVSQVLNNTFTINKNSKFLCRLERWK